MKRTLVFLILSLALLLSSAACQGGGKLVCKSRLEAGSADGGRITLAWDSNRERYLTGYRIYYGTSPGKYKNCVDIGNPAEASPGTTRYALAGLSKGTTYHIAVRAYGIYGGYSLESDFSNEVSAEAK